MLTLRDVRGLLVDGGIAATIRLNTQPDKPDEVVTIGGSGGLGLETDNLIDNPTFQVRVRGGDAEAVEALALRVDALILDADWPGYVGATRVVASGRLGGRPGYVGTDERGRETYSCNYWLKSER